MPAAPPSFRQLGAVVSLGLLAAVWTVLFPGPPRQDERSSAVFSIHLVTERAGAAQLYCDLGGGFAEWLSSRVDVKPGPVPVEYRFALPAGRVEGLRFDPIDNDARVTLARACIKAADGTILREFSPQDFLMGREIRTIEARAGAIVVVPVVDANDPTLLLKQSGPLILPGGTSPEVAAKNRSAASVQRWTGAGLALGGSIALLGAWWFRKRAPQVTAPGRWLEAAGVGYSALCVLFSRRPDVLTLPQFWAEDATVFFSQQHALGWAAAFQTHGGYLHFVPRVVAGLAELASVRYAPAIYLFVAVTVVLATVIKACSPRVGLPAPYWCALAIVLVPNMDEIAVNLTNAQWFGAVALLLVSLARTPLTRGELLRDGALVVVFGLSGPFSVLFLPLHVVRAARERTRATIGTALLLAALAAVQLFAIRHSPPPPGSGAALHLGQALAALGYRTGGQLLNVLPSPLAGDPTAWGFCALVFWLLLWVVLPVPTDFRLARTMLLAGALLVLAGGVFRYRETVEIFFYRIHVQRFLHLPLVATAWLVLAALGGAGARRWLAGTVLVVVLARNVAWYRVNPNVDYDWPRHAAQIEQRRPVEIPINPAGWVLSFRPPAK